MSASIREYMQQSGNAHRMIPSKDFIDVFYGICKTFVSAEGENFLALFSVINGVNPEMIPQAHSR